MQGAGEPLTSNPVDRIVNLARQYWNRQSMVWESLVGVARRAESRS
jgi:hypothetical protein